MNETAILREKIPACRPHRAEKFLQKLGLTPSDAVNLLLAQIEIRQGLSFEARVQSKPLLPADEQAAAWTEAYGVY